jgi:SAM-dependent methyltransferase
MRLDDPEIVRDEYATEDGLRARWSAYRELTGLTAPEIAFRAVEEITPSRMLEVGCGWGDFSARVAAELGVAVVAIDISPRMVELARERGVDARVGDVQELPFEDGVFECVAANWMLYHVPDLDRGLAELGRVLAPGGRLIAATNGLRHLGELWSLVGRDRAQEPVRFFAEFAEPFLREHFATIERRDVEKTITFAGVQAVRDYIGSSVAHKHLAPCVPEFDGPFVTMSRQVVFVAQRAA